MPHELRDSILSSGKLTLSERFVCMPGQEHLLAKSRDRERTNRLVNRQAKTIAEDFARDLVRLCPFVDCVALSGSASSGGYVPTDDIDFDIFVPDGTKYLTYALALSLGLRFSLLSRTGCLPRKIICINVIWTRGQVAPFVRKDSDLAFELLHCRPLVGGDRFREIVRRNEWIARFFPQVGEKPTSDLPLPEPSLLGKLLGGIARRPKLLSTAEKVGRILSFAAYRGFHWLQRNDRESVQRLAFLQRVKFPYEVFQD